MVVEYTNGARAVNMKANTKTIISMDSAAIPGQMAANIQENGKITKEMGEVN